MKQLKRQVKIKQSVKSMSAGSLLGFDKVPDFTDDDYCVINLLQKTTTSYGEFARKVKNRDCCWSVEIFVATVPSAVATPEYLARLPTCTSWEEANCDFFELYYHHEGQCSELDIQVIMSRIFLEFVDRGTHLLEAQARLVPMTLAERIRTHGMFKTSVGSMDILDIHYQFDPNLLINSDMYTRKFTNEL